MAKVKTRGIYYFADGTNSWFSGLSAREKKIEVAKHGYIVKFIPTD